MKRWPEMRVNVEDEIHADGSLGALARALSVEEDTALGRLVFVWRETQRRKLIVVTKDEFCSATKLRVKDPGGMLDAMIACDFASPTDDGRWYIRGNDKHIARLEVYQSKAQKGGIASQSALSRPKLASSSNKLASSKPKASFNEPESKLQRATNEPPTSHQRALLAPYSKDHDLDPSDPYLIQSSNSEDLPPSGKAPKNGASPSSRIRAAYLAGYEKKFGRPFGGWGAKANGQASQLIRDWPADRVIELLALFFEWNNPRAISAGYPFGFFVSAIHEIDADTHSPERKRLARTLDAAERQVSHKDAEQLTLDAELAQIRARRAEAERKALGAPSPTGAAS